MRHRIDRKKLNLKSSHRTALLRNQVIHFIENGFLQSTKPTVKEVQRMTEKLVTLARQGTDFNVRRRVKQLLPYKESAVVRLLKEIAPRYKNRPGGYTRTISMGRRISDIAPMLRLVWVESAETEGEAKR
ncbi:TPA: 50S ribosomal protein L17 [Candidatus Dependentiae bacterium]|nr:MAG: 50S ribosomal protein L17 [candidate division TM6 bacterium GW2011_GWF2_36_131]KKQ03058.1 MAG: 50S ribosomal protein L17 [candidate division TM6 bacterium GW2011_GWE2_36_25]KKQ19625.1 MAG: 50S ribosomal protein L17 [candidate division TM6 bacterium GW2011_GWA2_36_9]HBR71140.1 50S ribosomal protein L17 [Candidatus Dependentiae bacterium]HCU00483.1 50S ribosomal protein L17 [Candidatus Dependentiae bacterium]